MGALPKAQNALGKPWEHSRRLKTRRVSRGSIPEGRKRARQAMGALPKAQNALGKLLGALPKTKNAPGKPWEHSRRPKTRRANRGSIPEGRKHAGKAVGAFPKAENALGKPWEHSRRPETRRASIAQARCWLITAGYRSASVRTLYVFVYGLI